MSRRNMPPSLRRFNWSQVEAEDECSSFHRKVETNLTVSVWVTTSHLFCRQFHTPSECNSSKAGGSSHGQGIPCTVRNQQVHYRAHNSQIKRVHDLPNNFWRWILILTSHLRLDLPSDLFRSGFSKIRTVCPVTHVSRICPCRNKNLIVPWCCSPSHWGIGFIL
jgi:hypothetical protein